MPSRKADPLTLDSGDTVHRYVVLECGYAIKNISVLIWCEHGWFLQRQSHITLYKGDIKASSCGPDIPQESCVCNAQLPYMVCL